MWTARCAETLNVPVPPVSTAAVPGPRSVDEDRPDDGACSDWYGAYTAGPVTDPMGPAAADVSCSTCRVLRGGSWGNDQAAWVRSAYRRRDDVTFRIQSVGFRCARGA